MESFTFPDEINFNEHWNSAEVMQLKGEGMNKKKQNYHFHV